MPVRRFADFLSDLQLLEKASIAAQGPLILDAFARHTRFDTGALYLREGRNPGLRLAAKSDRCVAPEILDVDMRAEDAVLPQPAVVVPLQGHRESVGVLVLSTEALDDLLDDDVAIVRAAAAFVST
ncbi:MAG TPA: hypothetical protein VFV49_07810, partial [Thermoanaerobaculia bacterium]|nr:hypothetical protein [Thermoanaerobaculia bacterium]